jgi:flagellin-like protein
MKANRKVREGDERAASAVIGVILMVAITVAIAATVYVYVSGMLGGGAEEAPNMAFNKEITPTKRLLLVSADSGLTWGQFTVVGSSTTHLTTDPVIAGDELVLDMGAGYNTQITVTHIATNTLMGTWTWA